MWVYCWIVGRVFDAEVIGDPSPANSHSSATIGYIDNGLNLPTFTGYIDDVSECNFTLY